MMIVPEVLSYLFTLRYIIYFVFQETKVSTRKNSFTKNLQKMFTHVYLWIYSLHNMNFEKEIQ